MPKAKKIPLYNVKNKSKRHKSVYRHTKPLRIQNIKHK